MLKRFYSKRSGFTLVEIIIAFAIFAIMASMICQILDLAVKARLSNNSYQRDLNVQQQTLTLVEKKSDSFVSENDEDDYKPLTLVFEGMTDPVKKDFDRRTTKVDAEDDGEGVNFYLFNVDYQSDGYVTPTIEGNSNAGSNTGSQASRLDTRITGTAGIDNIQIIYVIKDTHTYAPGDPMAVPAGHTRYFFRISASSGTNPQTLKQEDVPYSQFRLHMYQEPDPDNPNDKSYIDGVPSSTEYVDANGKKYTKDVHKAAVISKVGYLNTYVTETIGTTGLKSTNVDTGTNDYNLYTIEQKGTNVVRIGSPFVTGNSWDPSPLSGADGKGIRFDQSESVNFYVEFVGDPHLTKNSFGYNATVGNIGSSAKYTACPDYLEEFDSDGTPLYNFNSKHVNIYGGYLQQRHYID